MLDRYYKNDKDYSVLSFARKVGNKDGKKLMDTATKTGMDAAKAASKRVVQKPAEATGDPTGNIIADKITSIGQQNVSLLYKNGISKNCKFS